MSLTLALSTMTRATAALDAARALPDDDAPEAAERREVAERAHDAPRQGATRAGRVAHAQAAMREALDGLLAAPAETDRDMIRKVVAVLGTPDAGQAPEALAHLRNQCADRLDPPEGMDDPAATLAARWLVLTDWLDGRRVEGTTFVEPPEVDDAMAAREAVFQRLCETTPTTAAGVAALADVAWRDRGPLSLPGTDGWARELAEPETRILARLRHGARVLAR